MSKVFPSFGLLASSGLLADSPPFTLFIDCFRMHIFKNFPFAYLNFDLRREPRCVSLFSDAFRSRPLYCLQPSYRSALSCRYLSAPLKVNVWKSWIDLRQATLEISRTQIYKGESLPNRSFFHDRKKKSNGDGFFSIKSNRY